MSGVCTPPPRQLYRVSNNVKQTSLHTLVSHENPSLVWQRHDFDFANVHTAPRVMLLKREMSFLECQGEVQVLVQFFAVDADFDSRHLATAPDVVTNVQLICEPCIRFDQ